MKKLHVDSVDIDIKNSLTNIRIHFNLI